MSDVILYGNGITKTFGALKALWNVDFKVHAGEILGIIGPNGAGKTTLLSVINGTLPLNHGEIYFKGVKISSLKPHQIAQLGIARTFQVVKPFPKMTALENVAIGSMFGKDKLKNAKLAMEKTRHILARVGLADKENTYVEKLNVSERKRLELARAVAMDPEVLLIDEVMAGLNQSEMGPIMDLILHLNADFTSIVVIEHVMKAIMTISHRIMVLHHGEKVAEGSPEEVSNDERVISAYLGQRYVEARSGDARGS